MFRLLFLAHQPCLLYCDWWSTLKAALVSRIRCYEWVAYTTLFIIKHRECGSKGSENKKHVIDYYR